jgi:hypothetical protein
MLRVIVRFRVLFSVLLALACLAAGRTLPAAHAQQEVDGEFFSGVVTEIKPNALTVNRTVLGKNPENRTFAITPETRVEGKPEVNERVTVRFSGGRAVHIIARPGQKR